MTESEVESTINNGERLRAKQGRIAFRKNFTFASKWKNRYYESKQVTAIIIEEIDALVVVTVYAFYFGGTK